MRRRAQTLFRVLSLWLLLGTAGRADEILTQVQRELRARKYYFGAIDGQPTVATANAVRAFQKDKGLDSHGPLDEETLDALGLAAAEHSEGATARKACADLLARYWKTCEAGRWDEEEKFYGREVDYYDDGPVDRSFVRDARLAHYERWPRRKYTVLNRYISIVPPAPDEALATLWVRTECQDRIGRARVVTEELRFRLRRISQQWKIVGLSLQRSWPEDTAPLKP